MKRLLILGSTGSIGTQALEVVARAREEFEIVGLSAASSYETVIEQAKAFGVPKIVLTDQNAAAQAAEAWVGGTVLSGAEGLVSLIAESNADLVLNAIVVQPGGGAPG